jgi:hypothetical protein
LNVSKGTSRHEKCLFLCHVGVVRAKQANKPSEELSPKYSTRSIRDRSLFLTL